MKKKKALFFGIGGAILAAALLIAAYLLFFRGPQGEGTYENLIRNGNFEQLNNDGMPEGWYTDAWVLTQGYTRFDTDTGMTGQGAHIVNYMENDARFAQTVSVSPNTLYCLHGYIRADAAGGLGANLSIEDLYVFSQSLYQTDGEWQEVSLYGRTGKKQHAVTVYVRLGGYSGEATGEAWFDDVTLCRVDQVPAGFSETLWYQNTADVVDNSASNVSREKTGMPWLILASFAYSMLFLLGMAWMRRESAWLTDPKYLDRPIEILGGMLLIFFGIRMLVAAFIPGYDVDIGCFRGWASQMANVGPMHFYDSGFCDYPPGYLWILWIVGLIGKAMGGISELLVKMPVLLADMALCCLVYWEAKKRIDTVSALALTGLLACNPLVLATGAAWGQTDSLMTLLLCITVLCALRGQWKAALPVYVTAVLVKPQALMFGPLGLAALILHLYTSLRNAKDKKARQALAYDVLLGLALALIAGAIIILPFTGNQSWDWLLQLYGKTMGEYGYATVNACNLYFLFGKNWAYAAKPAPGYIAAAALVLFAVPCMLAYCKTLFRFFSSSKDHSLQHHPDAVTALGCLLLCCVLLLAVVLAGVLGHLTYSILSICMIACCVLLAVWLLIRYGKMDNLPLLGAAMLLMIFATGGMMHERYLFPAVALLLIAYIQKQDKRILYLALAVSVMGLLNVGCALDRNIRIGGATGHLDAPDFSIQSDLAPLEYLSAIGNCLTGAAGIYLSCVLCLQDCRIWRLEKIASSRTAANGGKTAPHGWFLSRSAPLPQNAPLRPMTGKDWLILSVITVLYAVLAFTNLGSMKAPQTGWVSQANYESTSGNANRMQVTQEEVILDLGEERVFKMAYFGGIHLAANNPFSVSVSPDGETWTRTYDADVEDGDCFKWEYVSEYAAGNAPARLAGRYVRIAPQTVGLTLYETLFWDAETNEEILPVSVTSSVGNETAACLIDEPGTMEGEPGWYNSTYFDEIYHARTAFEHLHNMRPYETTHPPLGKVLMSFCIAIFGMTPFGWRFAGALAGVLMLPGMYLLGKLLIKKKWGGLGAALLMAFDLMHFTQTRIATIDSFVVLFIIWSVYFMLRWFLMDFFGTKFWKTLVPLGLSGLFMGFSIASKWTGCYAAVGLAVIFFFGLARRIREVQYARRLPDPDDAILPGHAVKKASKGKETVPPPAVSPLSDHDRAARNGAKPLILTVAFCFLFFIFIPLTIYYLSYIPYFAPSGGVTVQRVIEAAVGDYFTTGQLGGMLGYHSAPGLGMDHDFYSPWYQWPIIAKPMWYYNSQLEPAGMQSTIMAMGNPAVWWTGLIALFGVICLWAKRHIARGPALVLYPEKDDPRYALLIICFLAQYLPWMLVPRGTYIYHYFPSVPFIILCILLCLDWLSERGKKAEKAARISLYTLLAAALILFILFFPYASGITVPQKWLDMMKWFPRWLWY